MTKLKRGKHPLDKHNCPIKATKGIQVGSVIDSGDSLKISKMLVIGVKGVGGRLNRLPAGAPGDVVICAVKKGHDKHKKKIYLAVIVRQKQVFKRQDGTRLIFENNAAVVINGKGELVGSVINGSVPREVCEIWPKISSKASNIF
ncbi:60S ribosomal protein L23 [Cucumispora dikerogammari]|nr:60S ribosomal protein L23 [Cucumispora dikerogammari]